MRLPAATAYMEALQDPSTCFADPELAAATVLLGPLGLPRAVSGNVATVFRLDGAGGRSWAVRCFVRPLDDERARYDAIRSHLAGLAPPWRVPFDLQPCGVRVDGDWWPIVKMAWSPGTSLVPWVERHLWDGPALAYLAVRVAALAERLRAERVAHGDLQHGNVLVVPGGDVRLVDYDGMWVPALAGRPGTERGHRSYQHPGRQRTDFGPALDHFSSWVVYASLAALAADPLLWGRLDGGEEALLLREHDLADPPRSPGFDALDASDGPGVAALGALLRSFLDRDPADVPPLSLATAPPAWPGGGGLAPSSVASASGKPGGPLRLDQRRSLHEALAGGLAPGRPPGASVAARLAGAGGEEGTPSDLGRGAGAVAGARATVAAALLAAVVLGLAGAAGPAVVAVAGPAVVAVVAAVRLHRLYHRTPGARAARLVGEALAEPRRAAVAAAAAVERLTAERAASTSAVAAMAQEAAVARAELRRRREDELAAVDADLEAALVAVGEAERELQRAESGARAAALAELQGRVVDDHLGHHSLVAVVARGVSDQVVHRLSLDGVRTAADFTGVEVGRAGAVVVRRDGRRLTVGGVEPAQAAAMMAWRRQLEGAAQLKVPAALPPERVAAVRADHDDRRATLATRAGEARERARQRAGAVLARCHSEETLIVARVAAADVEAARRRVDLDRRLLTAGKEAAEAQWHLARCEREHGAVAPAGPARWLGAVLGLPRPGPDGAPSTGS